MIPQNILLAVFAKSEDAVRNEKFRAFLRFAFTLAILGGCTVLVFGRGESGWLYVPALFLIRLRRGI